MGTKERFKEWMEQRNELSQSTISSYLRAIELLSGILNEQVFSLNNESKLQSLYDDLLLHQKDIDGKYFVKKSPAYGERGFFSAAIKMYMNFLDSDRKNLTPKDHVKLDFLNLQKDSKSIGLQLSVDLIIRFVTSLITKPFVILTGLSGSGKTKLAQAFAMWICEDESQYCIVPVGADWTNREPLLGFPNALETGKYIKPDNRALDLIIEASKEENQQKPYFLILDEMNLSHVERYFADFLSVMESRTQIPLHSGDGEWDGVPAKIKLPANFFIVGTVNIDETTYMFSPKVLDRANVIEFRVTREEMNSYLEKSSYIDLQNLTGKGKEMALNFLEIAIKKDLLPRDQTSFSTELIKFFSELKKSGAEFGYRSASEILRFAAVVNVIEPDWKVSDIIDAAVMQKLLPKVHGSQRKLGPVLKTLGSLCLQDGQKIDDFLNPKTEIDYSDSLKIRYPVSFEKILRMYDNLISNGFTSYAEA